jgi:hypothetical protein
LISVVISVNVIADASIHSAPRTFAESRPYEAPKSVIAAFCARSGRYTTAA